MDDALGQRRDDVETDLRERKGRRRQHLPQLRRHVAAIHLLLAMSRDKITGLERPSHEAALQAAAIALQPQVLLRRRKHDFLGRLRFDLANFDKIAGADAGIGPLQAIEADKIQPFIFRIRQDRPRRSRLLADNFDDIALNQPQFSKILPRQSCESAAAVFRSGIGNLQFQLFAIAFGLVFWLRWIGHGGVSPQYRFGCFQQDRDSNADIRP